jgi:hypothetical protein
LVSAVPAGTPVSDAPGKPVVLTAGMVLAFGLGGGDGGGDGGRLALTVLLGEGLGDGLGLGRAR